MDNFFGLISIIVGRYLFGFIGAIFRFPFLKLGAKNLKFSEIWESREGVIDKEGFKNRIVGFLVILVCILIIVSQ